MRHAIEGEYTRYEQGQIAGLLIEAPHHVSGFAAVLATFNVWRERRRIRGQMGRDMRTFTDAMIEDAGMTRKEAEREVRKPFWVA